MQNCFLTWLYLKEFADQELEIAQRAREQGLLQNGGIQGNERTQQFLRNELALDTGLIGGTPYEKLEKIVEALKSGDYPLLAYTLGRIGHWVVIDDIRLTDNKVEISLMNPFEADRLEIISEQSFIRRLMANDLQGNEAVSASLLIVRNSSLPKVIARRESKTALPRVIDRRPGNT